MTPLDFASARSSSYQPSWMCFTSCGWTPTVAEMNGWRCARATAARLVSRSHPIVTKCPIPASRARWSIASQSASKRASSIWQWLSINMEFDYSTTDWYYPQPDEGSDEKLHWLFAAGAAGRLPADLPLVSCDARAAPCARRGRPGRAPALRSGSLLLGPKPYVVFDRRRRTSPGSPTI